MNTSYLFTTAMNQARNKHAYHLIYISSLSPSLSHTHIPTRSFQSNHRSTQNKIKNQASSLSPVSHSPHRSKPSHPRNLQTNFFHACPKLQKQIKSWRTTKTSSRSSSSSSSSATSTAHAIHGFYNSLSEITCEERVKKVQTDSIRQTTGKEGKRPRNPIGDMERKKREKAEKACDFFFFGSPQ